MLDNDSFSFGSIAVAVPNYATALTIFFFPFDACQIASLTMAEAGGIELLEPRENQ